MSYIQTDLSEYGKMTTGTYTGDGGTNKAIAHGLGVVPKFVGISNVFFEIEPCSQIVQIKSQVLGWIHDVTAANATNFYVGNSSRPNETANTSASTYYWVAFG